MTTNIKQLIKEVMDKGYLMSLATIDSSGVWVCDVIYIHDENLNIYWKSDPNVRHSKAIIVNNQVAGTITTSGPGENNLGIQFDGVAEKIEGSRHDLAIKHYAKRKKSAPKENDDVLQGDSWYILKPKKIELINEKLYKFDKKKIEL
ncbi:MAG: pyridoxamine 5'-phosphate oxidase family protein [Patescibacteria group bacterium]